MPTPDHDKLIAIEAHYEDFKQDQTNRLDELKKEWLKVFNEQEEKINRLSEEERATEKYVGELHLKEIVEEIKTLTVQLSNVIRWQQEFKLFGKFSHFVLWMIGIIIGITITLITSGKINLLSLFRLP